MNKTEAKAALKQGIRVRHNLFEPEEWIEKHSGELAIDLINQAGHIMDWYDFWKYRDQPYFEEGWEMIPDEKAIREQAAMDHLAKISKCSKLLAELCEEANVTPEVASTMILALAHKELGTKAEKPEKPYSHHDAVPITINEITDGFDTVQAELNWLMDVCKNDFTILSIANARSLLIRANKIEAVYHLE